MLCDTKSDGSYQVITVDPFADSHPISFQQQETERTPQV